MASAVGFRCGEIVAARVRDVHLAQELADHLGVIVVVGDEGQELAVDAEVRIPIGPVEIGDEHLLLHLPPHVVVHVGLLGGLVEDHLAADGHGLGLAALGIDLHDPPVDADEQRLAVGGQLHSRLVRAQLGEELGVARPGLGHPEVVALLEAGQVKELLAVLGQGHIGDVGGGDGQADLAPVDAVELEDEVLLRLLRLDRRVFGLGLVFVGLVLVLLGLVLLLLEEGELLLGQAEPVVGGPGEEHAEDVVFPGRAVGVDGAFPGIGVGHHRPVHPPAGHEDAEAVLGQIDDLALAVARDEPDLRREQADESELDQEPLAVRAPLVGLVAVGVGIVVVGGQDRPGLFGGQVDDLQDDAVLQVGDLLAVGREFRLELLGRGGHDRLFLEHGRSEEVGLFLADDRGLIDVPVVVALGGIDERPAVGAEADAPLLAGRIGDALGQAALHAADEDLAAEDIGHFLSVGREPHLGDASADGQRPLQHLAPVLGDADVDLPGGRRAGLGVDLAVVAEAEKSVLGAGQEADGVLGEIGQRGRDRRLAQRALDRR